MAYLRTFSQAAKKWLRTSLQLSTLLPLLLIVSSLLKSYSFVPLAVIKLDPIAARSPRRLFDFDVDTYYLNLFNHCPGNVRDNSRCSALSLDYSPNLRVLLGVPNEVHSDTIANTITAMESQLRDLRSMYHLTIKTLVVSLIIGLFRYAPTLHSQSMLSTIFQYFITAGYTVSTYVHFLISRSAQECIIDFILGFHWESPGYITVSHISYTYISLIMFAVPAALFVTTSFNLVMSILRSQAFQQYVTEPVVEFAYALYRYMTGPVPYNQRSSPFSFYKSDRKIHRYTTYKDKEVPRPRTNLIYTVLSTLLKGVLVALLCAATVGIGLLCEYLTNTRFVLPVS